MELNLHLMENKKWKINISDDYSEIKDNKFVLNIELIEINKIQEPYIILPDAHEVSKVKESILTKGFLHPILVFKENNNYILADGTHRIEALQQLKCNLIPVLIIKREEAVLDSWVKILKSKSPPYKSIYKKVSPNQRKNIIHQEYDLLSIDSLLELQHRNDVIAVYSDGKNVHVFSNKDQTNRLEHLRLMKYFDEVLDHEDKEYTLISKTDEKQFNYNKYLMIPPPNDVLNDLDYLIKNKDLRIPKAFRIQIPIRLVHIPISVEVLKLDLKSAIEHVTISINECITSFSTIFLKLSFSKSLDISWYYHILLIGSKMSFLSDLEVNSKEAKRIKDFFDPIKLIESESLELTTS